MGKRQKHKESSHIREPKATPFPAGDHKAAINKHDSMTNTKYKITKWIDKKEAPPWNGQ